MYPQCIPWVSAPLPPVSSVLNVFSIQSQTSQYSGYSQLSKEDVNTIWGYQDQRRLTMVTRYWPPSSVEPIMEGLDRRATNTVMRRVMNGVCGHGHSEVLMGVKGNSEVVKDRPWILPSFYHLPIRWSLCTDQPHMTSSAWSWTILFLFLARLLLSLSFPWPTSAPIADSPSFPFWLMFSSFGSFLSHTLFSFVPNVRQHGLCTPGLCAGSYSIYTCPYLL